MKNLQLFIIVLFLFVGFSSKAQQVEVLTNKSIVGMYSAKLPTSIIIEKIKSSKNSFDISTNALVSLSNDKLPSEIINAMIGAANDSSKHVIQMDPNNPNDMHEVGIYYYTKDGDKAKLTQLEPSIYSQSKSRGALASALTYGIAKVKSIVTLDGKHAQLQLQNAEPVFYFYFNETGNPLGKTSNWWFSANTNPDEFLLVKLSEKRKTRNVTTGSAGIGGTSIGVADKNKATFRVKKIATGIYKVYFDEPLSGEYCFMYAGNVPTGFTAMNKVYDFGIENK